MAFLLDPGHDEVLAAAEASRRILADLRARPLLERLEAALAGAESSVTPLTCRAARTPRRA